MIDKMSRNRKLLTDRVDYIDIFRGIGILLMVMGHTNSFGGYFNKFIHAFHVPMFFVIAGWLLWLSHAWDFLFSSSI